MLDPPLLCLAVRTHLVVVLLAGLVTSQAGNGTTERALSAVGHAGAEVAELTLGLLLLALEVLLAAGVLERLQRRVVLAGAKKRVRRSSTMVGIG